MSTPARQPRPAPLGVPLAAAGIILNDVQAAITDISNATVGVFDALNAEIAICNDLRANGAFQISNADDAATVGFAVEEGTQSYDLTLPMALPTSTRFLTVDTLGAMGYGDAGVAPWSSCFSGAAGALGSIVIGNVNEGKSDAEWADLATEEGALLLQQDQSSGAVLALTPSPNALTAPAGPAGYALPAGTSYRTLSSPNAVIYKNLFVPATYYSLSGYAFQTIQNYSSGTAPDESTAMTTAMPTGAKGAAVINMKDFPGPVVFDYAADPVDANALPVPLEGYNCYIRSDDLPALINAFPGPWLDLAWQRTIYPTV